MLVELDNPGSPVQLRSVVVSDSQERKVMLREGASNLWAYVDVKGNLHIDGQDLGPMTASVSSDGEYEYFKTIEAKDVPRVLVLLDAPGDADVLEVLSSRWTGAASFELEQRLSQSDIPVKLFVY